MIPLHDCQALSASGDWTDLCSLGMVISERSEHGETTRETRYYSMSFDDDVQEFRRAVRAHWSIENRLHWWVDVVFREDESPKYLLDVLTSV